jgi:hypothetical protein
MINRKNRFKLESMVIILILIKEAEIKFSFAYTLHFDE